MVAPTTIFTQREMQLLTAVCDTLTLGDGSALNSLMVRKASDLNVPQVLAEALAQIAEPDRIRSFKLALQTLDQPLVNGLLGGKARSFLELSPAERTLVLRAWSSSPLPLLRAGFQAFKRLTLFLFYTVVDAQSRNPNWEQIDYAGPPTPPSTTPKLIQPLELNADTTLDTDVVIVGSGAGGSVVAGELAAAGFDVIVIEKGGYHAERDFHGREMDSAAEMFENRGFLTSNNLGVIILAGSTLGGGTTINWCASFRTPPHVLEEWEKVHGVTGYTGADYQSSLDAVSSRINVNTKESIPNFQNASLERGGQRLGWKTGVIARNVNGCEDCGFCNYGCQFGSKQSTLRTYLLDAHQRGARIAVNAQIENVLIERGKAIGVVGKIRTSDGRESRLTVKARAVVISAGALHTPVLLLRSGLGNTHIGRNLHLHPTSLTYGMYEQPVRGWSGVMMSRYISEFSNLDDGYGVSMQTAPIHPGIAALVLPWSDGAQHKRMMQQIAHLANIIVITRDRDGGRIKVSRSGNPLIDYRLSSYDAAHLRRGVLESLKVHLAAGAAEIGGPHSKPISYQPAQNGNGSNGFDKFQRMIATAHWRPNSFALLSAHQMSSCRMGGSAAQGVLTPQGETYEVTNLFVADASTLPTALGVNPMLTIMGVAHHIAQHIKSKLN